MTSYSFSFSGHGPVISHRFFPQLELPPGHWELGLQYIMTANSIPNVQAGENARFAFVLPADVKNNIMTPDVLNKHRRHVTLPTGCYELDDIAAYIKNELKAFNETIKIDANLNTLQTELKSTVWVDFADEHSIAPLLGFRGRVLKPNLKHVSEHTVDIAPVNVIRVKCNLIKGSYSNGKPDRVLHEFPLVADPGDLIDESPWNMIYLPVDRNSIDEVVIQLVDQNDKLLNLRGEKVSLRLELRKMRH
jgi:hypothetical protein